MAWKDLTDNQMVSFTDAQTSGFDLNYCQNSVTSDKCMDVSDIATKYFMGAPAGYSSNQLVPKGLWSSPFYDTLQLYRSWTGMTVDSNGDVYACTTFPGDIYKLNKSATPPNFNKIISTEGYDIDNIVFSGMTVTPDNYIYTCISNGDIYKKSLCYSGDLTPIGGTNRNWSAMTSTTGGIVYACVNGGDIYSRLGPSDIFVGLGQTSRAWRSMTIDNDGNVWACVWDGDIYKQTAGGGNFVAQFQGNRRWRSMTTAPNGDIYAAVYNGDVYKKPSYADNFYPLDQSWDWVSITAVSNGDIYAVGATGDVYKLTGGVGNFTFIPQNTFDGGVVAMDYNSSGNIFILREYIGDYSSMSFIYQKRIGSGEFLPTNQTNREWSGMASDNSGGVWACVWNGGIYKKLDPAGTFVSLGQANRKWTGMTVDNEGNVWACVYDGDIYKQTAGSGNFVATGQTSRKWRAMATAANGTIYACTQIPNSAGRSYDNGAIYQLNPGTYKGFADLAVGMQGWVGLAGTPDNTMWAMSSTGNYYKLVGAVGNNFVYVDTTMDADGLCSTLAPSGSGNIYSYRRDYAIIKNPKPGTTSTTIYYNTQQSATVTRDNCPEGYTAGTATLTVAANTFSSSYSVPVANQLAYSYLYSNVQAYANANASCTASTVYYNTEQSLTLARDNCPSGYIAGDATLTVAANTYSSYVSVAVANQLAIDYLYDNAQAYANANGTCTAVYYNTQQSGTATRNNCSSGYAGSTVTLTVAANTYSSLVSLEDANNKAITYIDANKQAYANANGTCTAIYYNTQQSTTATRNNCSSGYAGSTETLIAQAGTFTSTIGVQDANNKAIAYLDLNAQSYANANGTCTLIVYYNTQQSGTATRDNCSEGYGGSTVTLTVAANTYSSSVSVADANSQAVAYIDANKQAYANANGTCTSICTSYRHVASRDSTIYWTSCNGTPSSRSTSRFGSYTICALTGTYSGGAGSWTNLGACTSSTIYYNTQQSGTATRDNCPEGYTAGTATLTVAADTFSSLVSVADANSQAVVYIDANKQAYANANGTCTAIPVYYNTEQSTTATKNDCSPGYVGSTVTITISANEYSSLISVEDANNQVIAYLDANKQSIANTEGSCSQEPSVTYDYYGYLFYNDPCQGGDSYYIGSDGQWYVGDGTNFSEVTGTFAAIYSYYDWGSDQYYYDLYNLAYGGALTYWGSLTSQCAPY